MGRGVKKVVLFGEAREKINGLVGGVVETVLAPTLREAVASLGHFVGVNYHRQFPVVPGVQCTFFDAGHILGSAIVVLDIAERDRRFRLTFTGDLARGARDRWLAAWQAAVGERHGDGALARRLLARPLVVLSRSPEAVLARFAGLAGLADAGLMLHEAASRQFWGLSKLLNGQQEAIALMLGLAECPFPNRPVQLVIQTLAGELDAPVLFVENAASFESLAAGRMPEADGHILIFASGYKASARRIRMPGRSSLYFAPQVYQAHLGLPAAIQSWLYSADTARPVFFWGDLDYAGLAILRELRAVFANAQAWQPGYERLLERLLAGESHAPEEAAKSGQTDPVATGCGYADEVLLPALRRYGRFVDQESV
ncbi:MAG: hypothetical protein HGA75_10670 [Thiobacillus sp.]|nr:hypothetical protein [Thiobacillus sp.]